MSTFVYAKVGNEAWEIIELTGGGGSLPAWWTIDSTPGSESVDFDGDVKMQGALLWPVAGQGLDVTVDTTTYDDSLSGVGKFTTLLFPAGSAGSAGALAIAFEGDAFPRVVMAADPTYGTFMTDGTLDPLNAGAASWIEAGAAGEFVHVIEGGGATQLRVGVADPNAGRRIATAGGLTFGTGAPGDPQIRMSSNDPNTNISDNGGNVGDLFFRQDGGVGTTIYRCTVAGTPGNTTWVGIL